MFVKITCIALLWCTGGKKRCNWPACPKKREWPHTQRSFGSTYYKVQISISFPPIYHIKTTEDFSGNGDISLRILQILEALQCYVDLLVPNNCA